MKENDLEIEINTNFTVPQILEQLNLLEEIHKQNGNTEVAIYIAYLRDWVNKQIKTANISFRKGTDGIPYPVADYSIQQDSLIQSI